MHLRVYADRDHYTSDHRRSLNDILKALWTSASSAEQQASYRHLAESFEFVSNPEAADLHLLTMDWQHYIAHGTTVQAVRAVEVARRAGRPIAVFSKRDSEANFPVDGTDIHLFQCSGYRSRRRQQHHGLPAFIPDPLPEFCGGSVQVLDKGPRPLVGFCGQAGASLGRQAARLVRAKLRVLQWRLGRSLYEPAPFEHTWFRERILDRFDHSESTEARFVRRTRYRAGLSNEHERLSAEQRSRREFIDNILSTNYTVCVRGGGNFSVRFYEALALGRIPVFIDTDCILPFHHRIDWRRYCVWIDARDAMEAPNIVADFHARLSAREFQERQLECRRLWEERLAGPAFYARLHEHFGDLEPRS